MDTIDCLKGETIQEGSLLEDVMFYLLKNKQFTE